MNVYTDELMRLGKLTFGENAEGRASDFGKRELFRRIAAGFRQIGVFFTETSGWNHRTARKNLREIGESLDDSLYELGTTVYSAYFKGEIDNPTLEAECRIFSPTPTRSEWLTAMGFTPIIIEEEAEEKSVLEESFQAA